ncbi:MAG TPA: D-alanyl-D-alanine carboxypeptidase [Pyrinomonadaceae bacterium]|jgi:D-alanyl-D-alanine carboxypeptidase/D-alanyl-D-alanine-endopeptidase (penicillin-binding protein 4)
MNPRKPIYALMVIGAAAILALTFAPYALMKDARRAAAAYIQIPLARTASAVPPAFVPAPAAAAAPAFDVPGWYSVRGDDPARHALLVQSNDGRVTLAEHNADAAYNPASLVKLSTSLVALRKLGKDFRFETKFFVEGDVDKSGVLRGRIVAAGNDPTFGDFHATLVAKKLAERGVKKFEGELAVSPDFVFNFTDKPEESAQRLAKVVKLNPKTFAVAEAPAGEPTFAVLSYPLRDVLLYMNAHSSNFVAERLGALVGGPEGVREFLVNEVKLPPEQVQLATTSGLEVNRMTPRGLVAVIRALDDEARRQGLELVDIMAVASGDYGTLRRRMVGTPLEGAVVAKTGTLVHDDGGMASLGGVVYTQKFGKVYFVVLNQGSAVAESRQLTDELLSEITLSQDTPAPIPKPEKPRHQLESTDLEVLE